MAEEEGGWQKWRGEEGRVVQLTWPPVMRGSPACCELTAGWGENPRSGWSRGGLAVLSPCSCSS